MFAVRGTQDVCSSLKGAGDDSGISGRRPCRESIAAEELGNSSNSDAVFDADGLSPKKSCGWISTQRESVCPCMAELLFICGWNPDVVAGISLEIWSWLIIRKIHDPLGAIVDSGQQELVVCGLFWLDTEAKRLQQFFDISMLNRIVPGSVNLLPRDELGTEHLL